MSLPVSVLFIKLLQKYYKKHLLISSTWCMIVEVISQAPVAQLDRARASDARCRKFESCQVHFLYPKIASAVGDGEKKCYVKAMLVCWRKKNGTEKLERIVAEV